MLNPFHEASIDESGKEVKGERIVYGRELARKEWVKSNNLLSRSLLVAPFHLHASADSLG